MSMGIKKSVTLQKIMDGFMWLIMMSIMTFSITYMITYALTFAYSPIKLAGIAFIVLSILSVIFFNKYTISISGVLIVMAMLGGSFYLQKKELLQMIWNRLIREVEIFGQWSIRCIRGYPVNEVFYIHYFTVILCIFIACFVYFFTAKKFCFSILFLAGVSAFVFEVTQKREINSIALYLFVFSNLIYFFKNRYFAVKKQLDENDFATYKAFMKIGTYIGCGIFITAMLLSHTAPYKAKWIHALVESLTRKEYYYTVESFSVKSAGFGEDDSTLGGDIAPNDVPVLEVNAPAPTYLKALSQSIYTGHAWTSEEEEKAAINLKEEQLRDTEEILETFNWISDGDQNLDTMFFRQKADIRFVNMSTKSLFVPARAVSLTITSWDREIFITGFDTLSLEKPANKNFTYTTEFYEPRVTHEKFKEILRKSKIGYYRELRENNPPNAVLAAKWMTRAEELTKKYTQLPEDLPKRVSELAYSVTKEQATNYDKIKALEEYLAKNYTYTLKPGLADENEDFVDHFLFENKKGYCTYFASALAVMTRSLGIPARYVEGYSLPNSRDTGKNAYVVTNKRAHAWVEVYFEGVGWIIFEATPPYRQTEGAGGLGMSMEEAMRYAQAGNALDYNFQGLDGIETAKTYNILVLSLLGLICVIVFWYGIRSYRLKKMKPRKAALHFYGYYLKMLARCNLKISAGETETVFARRTDEGLILGKLKFLDITQVFLKAKYSQIEITIDEKEKMINFRHELLRACRRKLNALEYITWDIRNRFL